MWYLQFFFYAWGAANIPQRLGYVNWMLHMSIYVLCGGLVGLALGEWAGVRSTAHPSAVGRNSRHHRRGKSGWSGHGIVTPVGQFNGPTPPAFR